MRVVTVGDFGTLTPEPPEYSGYNYEGDSWLLRFLIGSEEHFFKDQLPNMVRVLGIDIRQIMRLVLYGNPRGGLFDVRVFISFQEPPGQHELGQLRLAVPESPIGDHPGGILEDLLLEFVKNSTKREKHSVRTALLRNDPATKKQLRVNATRGHRYPYLYRTQAGFRSGNLLRLHWQDELSPSFADWCNLNFYLAEALRNLYDPQKLIRLEFRAIPDTEHLYDIDAEVLVEGPVRVHPVRMRFKTDRAPKRKAMGPPSGGTTVVKFEVMPPPLEGLDEEDRELIAKFKQLPLERRMRIWQEHIAPHFR